MRTIIPVLAFIIWPLAQMAAQASQADNWAGPYSIRVNTYNGNLFLARNDLHITSPGFDLDFTFAYNSMRDTLDIGFGDGWTFSYGVRYYTLPVGVALEWADGHTDTFALNQGAYVAPKGDYRLLEPYAADKLRLVTPGGTIYYFDDATHKRLTTVVDANGNTLTFNYLNGVLAEMVAPNGRSVGLTWNNGRLASLNYVVGAASRTVYYAYTSGGQLKRVVNPLGNTIEYAYDTHKRMAQLMNERGNVAEMEYDATGSVALVKTCVEQTRFDYNRAIGKTYITEQNDQSSSIVTAYTYDGTGRLLQKTGTCCGGSTAYTYDSENNIAQTTDAKGQALKTLYDNKGNPVLYTNALGHTAALTYGTALNKVTQTTNARGFSTEYQYDSKGNVTAVKSPINTTYGYTYNNQGDQTGITFPKGNTIQMAYDANGDIAQVQYPIGTWQYAYDEWGNISQKTDGNGVITAYTYDSLNRMTELRDGFGQKAQLKYDGRNNLVQKINPNNQTSNYTYDAYDRLVGVTTPTGKADYAYNALSLLSSVTDANGHTLRYTYNGQKHLEEEVDPMGRATRYAYDANGNMETRTTPDGKVVLFQYDALNRLVQKTYEGNTDNYEYDANSNLIRCSNQYISIRFTYDEIDRMVSKTYENWGKTITYTYDANNNRASMTDPDNGTTTYEYDANDRLTKMTNGLGEVTQLIYDAGGRVIEQRHQNGTKVLYTYDLANQITAIAHQKANGTPIATYQYTYDAAGNRTAMDATGTGNTIYTYDADSRVVEAVSANISEQFEYDSTGNRLAWVNGATTTNYTYNAANELLTAGTSAYQYDERGNQVQVTDNNGQSTRFEFDGDDRLVLVRMPNGTETAFQYDPLGNRIVKTTGNATTRYVLDGSNMLLELDGNNQTKARYTSLLRPDGWVSMRRNGQTYYYHTDALGSVRQLTNAAQNTVATYAYGTYGNLLQQTGNIENPITYTGREWDAETNLYYYRARYYDAQTGRFISKDAHHLVLQRPLSLHRYAYTEGNPVNYTDPTGEWIWLIPVLGAMPALIDYGAQTWANRIEFGKRYSCYEYKIDLLDILGFTPWSVGGAAFGAVRKLFGAPNVKQIEKAISEYSDDFTKLYLEYLNTAKRYHDKNLATHINRFREHLLTLEEGKKYAKLSDDLVDLLENLMDLDDTVDELQNKGEADESEEEGWSEIIVNGSKPCRDSRGIALPPSGGDMLPGLPDIDIPIVRAFDPNEIIPPAGVGSEKWVAGKSTLPYTILFENDPDFATAPAQKVVITHVLDNDLNPFTFRLGGFGFGGWFFEVPADQSYYSTRIDLSDSLGIYLDVLATIDIAQKQAIWVFESIDPATGLSATLPADAGFLPVNDTLTRAGEGFVRFTVVPKATAPTGNLVEAQASIVFDQNPPILTNLAFNTLDADAPKSSITMIDTVADGYRLHFAGTDNGSGIQRVGLYVAVGNGPFVPRIGAMPGSPYLFATDPDSTYRFFTIATDSVGNVELAKYTAEPSCMQVSVVNLTNTLSGTNTGSITLEVAGNSGPVSYEWAQLPGLQGAAATGLGVGTYTVTARDTAGCVVALSIEIKAFTGVKNLPDTKGLVLQNLYPIPSTGWVNMVFVSESEWVFAKVVDLEGKTVFRHTFKTLPWQLQTQRLDLGQLPSGMYVLQLLSPTGAVVTGQVVIGH